MVDLFGQILWYSAPIVPVIVAAVVAGLLRRKPWRLRIAVALPYAVLVVAGLLRIMGALVLRDGLAVGMEVTSGGEAFRRALPGMTEGGMVLIVAAFGIVLMWRGQE